MFLSTEILTMVVCIIGLPLVRLALRSANMPGRHLFLAGYYATLLANICTVAEGVALAELCNLLEHLLVVVAAVLFCLAIVRLFQGSAAAENEDGVPWS